MSMEHEPVYAFFGFVSGSLCIAVYLQMLRKSTQQALTDRLKKEAQRQQVLDLSCAGKQQKDIAKQVGLSPSTVSTIIRRFSVLPAGRGPSAKALSKRQPLDHGSS